MIWLSFYILNISFQTFLYLEERLWIIIILARGNVIKLYFQMALHILMMGPCIKQRFHIRYVYV